MEKRITDRLAEIFAIFLLIVLSDAIFATWYVSPARFTVSTEPLWANLSTRHIARAGLYGLGGIGLVAFARDAAMRVFSRQPSMAGFALLPLLSVAWSIAPSRTAYEAYRLLTLTVFAAWASTWDLHRRVRVFAATAAILLLASYTLVLIPGSPGIMTSEVIEALEQHQSAPPRTDAPAPADGPVTPNLSAFLAYQRAHSAAPPVSVEGRWRGVFSHKNELAAAAALALATLPWLATQHVLPLPMLLIGVCLTGVAMVQTRSTGAGAALLCAWAAFAVARTRSKWIRAAFGGLAVLGVGLATSQNPTLTGRTFLWTEAWRAVLHHPWLGHGYGAFWRAAPEAARIDALWPMHPWHAHNSWLDMALDTGVLGVVAFVAIVVLRLRPASPSPSAWATLALVFTLSLLEHSLQWSNGAWGVLWFAALMTLMGVTHRAGFSTQLE